MKAEDNLKQSNATQLQQKHSMLILDDEPYILDMFTDFFQHDYTIYTASDPETALQILRQHPEIELIIADQRLPKMTGIDFLKKSREYAPDAERIIITAYADLDSVLAAINEAHVSYYFPKPIDLYQIKIAIEQLCNKIELQKQNVQLIRELEETNRQIEEKIRQRTAELQEALRELQRHQELQRRFFNIAIHDLKNPLSTIQMICSQLKELVQDEHLLELIELADTPLATMEELVADILELAKIGTDKQAISVEPVDIRSLLQALVYEYKLWAEKKSIELRAEIPANLPPIEGDYHKLRLVFSNLISNAIKYTPSKGRVTVTVHHENSSVHITVSDTGLGMTQEDIQKAFQEFQTLSARPTGGENSTGLGLYIVKTFVDLHHGKVSVQSEGRGKGTTFTVELPLKQPAS